MPNSRDQAFILRYLSSGYISEDFGQKNLVFDGELCLIDENGNDDFQGIMKQIRRKDHTIPNPKFKIFDFIPLDDFNKKESSFPNINESRTGIIDILKIMKAKIILKNKKNYKGEKIADIHVKSAKSLKSINCPAKLNSSAIDEFLIIFLVAATAKGISYFKNLGELNKKESKRLYWGSKILNMIGVKNKLTRNHGIKIWGQPNLKLYKSYEIKNYLKDHRVMAMSTIAALTLGGKWKIHNPESIKTSFPSFFKILQKDLGSKINT